MSRQTKGPVGTLISILVLLVLVGSFLSLFIATVGANDQRDKDNDRHGYQGPDVNVQKGPDSATLDSTVKTNSSEDQLHLNVDLANGLDIQLSLQHKAGNLNTKISYNTRFICLAGLKENEKSGTVPCDTSDKNRTVMLFSKMTFNEPSYYNFSEKNQLVHKFGVSSKDGKFNLQFELTGTFDTNSTRQPAPMTMRIGVHCFEYGKDDKYLGLEMKVMSNVYITIKKDLIGQNETAQTHNPAYNKDEELGTAVLALNDRATVDGKQKDVSTTTSESSDGKVYVTMVYPRGETINHNMEMSIQPLPIILKGDLPTYGVAIGATVAVFAITDKHVLALLARKGK